jgi:hypothetical protein
MADRVDQNGAAYAGSQLQTQLDVNKRTAELDTAIRVEFPQLVGATFDWRSPLVADNYREYYGAAFLERVDLGQHVPDLEQFWPSRGPQWDALAVLRRPDDDRPGVLLVEGKSYTDEMLKGAPTTSPPGTPNRQRIDESLSWAQQRIGMQGGTAAADWTGVLYQNANRLAHLVWLSSLGIEAWFVHALFVEDPHRPTTADEWAVAVKTANQRLGLDGVTVDRAGHVLLLAGARAELIAD